MARSLTPALLALAALGCGADADRPAVTAEQPATGPSPAGGEAAPAPLVQPLAEAPRRGAPNGAGVVSLLAEGRRAFLARLEMEPGATVPVHQDPDEEYLVVLEGHGELTLDGTVYQLEAPSTVFMPAGATVSYRNGDERLVAIQVFAGPGSGAKYDRWQDLSGAP
ncbi:MAG: cupin domain-containing protein [Sandaracinaceae bacterium]